jgi:hypothetical protein
VNDKFLAEHAGSERESEPAMESSRTNRGAGADPGPRETTPELGRS